MKAFTYRRVKNDERDAADLADLLRMDRLAEAWIAPRQVRELRELTRYRHKLVHLRTSCKDQVHAVLAKLGVPVTCSDIFGKAGSAWLDGLGLPQPYAGKVISLRQLTGELATEITMLNEVIADLLAGHRGYHVIQQLPGIGPVLAAVIIAEIGDVTRFRSAGQLCSWAGLTPRHRESELGFRRDRSRARRARPGKPQSRCSRPATVIITAGPLGGCRRADVMCRSAGKPGGRRQLRSLRPQPQPPRPREPYGDSDDGAPRRTGPPRCWTCEGCDGCRRRGRGRSGPQGGTWGQSSSSSSSPPPPPPPPPPPASCFWCRAGRPPGILSSLPAGRASLPDP